MISGTESGTAIRVIFNGRTAFAYTNVTDEPALLELSDTVSNACKDKAFDKDIKISTKNSPEISPIKQLPSIIPLEKKIDCVKKANTLARKWDSRIKQVRVMYQDYNQKVVIVNSNGELVQDERIGTLFSVQVVATQDGELQTGYEPVGGTVGFEIFDQCPPEQVAEIAAGRAVQMLEARKARGGTMPVVLSSDAGGTMIHEAIGHGLEADLAQEGLSVYANRIGEEIASPFIKVVDDATIPNKGGSYRFDDEGVPSRKSTLVQNGVLVGYLYDRLSATKDKVTSTGNGRRESYRHRPIPRMTNTYIAPGDTTPEEILRSTPKGLYVVRMGGGQVNTINGDFVFEVSEGYLIENGKVGEPVRGATLTGNGPHILKSIDMIGNDLGFNIGTCGKDGQGCPVSSAQPTLRIPEIVVGGEI
jgi:TldD protein